MPVITPAYPSMFNTNVTKSTLAVMTAEFARGSEIMLKIEQGLAQWSDLFARSISSPATATFSKFWPFRIGRRASCWSGFVESKVRILMNKSEMEANIAVAPPFTETFEQVIKSE